MKLCSMIFVSHIPKYSNQNPVFIVYSVLIGCFSSMSTIILLKSFYDHKALLKTTILLKVETLIIVLIFSAGKFIISNKYCYQGSCQSFPLCKPNFFP